MSLLTPGVTIKFVAPFLGDHATILPAGASIWKKLPFFPRKETKYYNEN